METHKIDAKNRILGRLAVETAILLRGKHKPNYLPYLDQGDKVIVFNTDKIKVTGRKLKQKIYRHHSGYLGHLKETPLEKLLERDSREVIRRAVYNMLPKNKLRDKMIRRLILYKGEEGN